MAASTCEYRANFRWRERTALVTWSRMAEPVAGEGTEGIDELSMLFIPVPKVLTPMRMVLSAAPTKPSPTLEDAEATPLVPLLTSGTHTISAVRVTRVMSGDWGLRMMVPSTMAGDAEPSWEEAEWSAGMVAKTSSVNSSLEDTMSTWRLNEKSFLTGFPVAVLSMVRRLTKAKVTVGAVDVGWVAVGSVAVFIGISLALVVLEFGLDWSMKWGRLVRMDCWIDRASVCTIEVMVLVRQSCLLARMVCVVVVECSRCSAANVEMTLSEAVVEMILAIAEV